MAQKPSADCPPISNGGFEQADADGIPLDWETTGGKVVRDIVHSGEQSLAIRHTSERTWSHLNRYWKAKSGKQGAMLPVLRGEIVFWYRILSAVDANIWLGVIPMSADPWENTGESRTGITVPAAHIGDGLWHQAVVSYDYPEDRAVRWVHVSCFVRGESADIRLDDIAWSHPELSVTELEVEHDAAGGLRARASLRNTGNWVQKGAVADLGLPDCLSFAPGEESSRCIYSELAPGGEIDRPLEWRLQGTFRPDEEIRMAVQTRMGTTVTARRLGPSGCVGELYLLPTDKVQVPRLQASDLEPAPPVPAWFREVTRVAYTDASNLTQQGDWPDKVLEDLGKAGVQLFFSRAHSGESWPGVGWRSALSETALGRTVPQDWTGSGISLTEESAHTGERAVRIEHTSGRKESYLIRSWQPHSGRKGALLDILRGTASFWYKAIDVRDANLWLGVLPMSADPWENTGRPRTGMTIPKEHIGDGLWHQAEVPFDYQTAGGVTWIHVGCFITGTEATVLLDDIELQGLSPQPVTNGGFENDSEDRTRRVADLCHRNGMRYLAYFLGMKEPEDVWRDHPEWQCLDRNGKPASGRFCPNNPAYREFMKARFAEIITTCGVDGIFIDMHNANMNEGYCEHCVRRFRELTGESPPVQEDFDSLLWQAWIRFKYRSIEEAMLDYNRAIKAANPEAVLVVNSWNAWTYRRPGVAPSSIGTSIRLAETVDGLLEELGWYDLDGSFFSFPTRFNFMSWHLGGLAPQRPALAWGHPSEWAGGGSTQSCEARIRVMTMITNGAVAAHSVPARDVLAEYMQDIARRETYLRQSHLYPWCGLMVSEKTQLWYGRDDPLERYIKGVYGAFQVMLENHLPVSLVTDRLLETDDVSNYRVLFLPNCAIMSDAELEAVRTFVRNGGGLVATYETSRYDEHAWPRANLGLADLFGTGEVTGTFDNRQAYWLTPPSGRSASLVFPGKDAWCHDPVISERMTRGSLTTAPGTVTRNLPVQARILQVESDHTRVPIRMQTWRPCKTDSNKTMTVSQRRAQPKETSSETFPGIIEQTYGKGKVIYIPADLSWTFHRYGHDFLGRILELALREVASEPPPVEVDAPRSVQVMTHVQGNRLVVHLLNDISSFGRSANVYGESLYIRREVIPIHDIRLTFRPGEPRRFLLIPGETELVPTQTETGVTVTLPCLDIHAMVAAIPMK